MTKRWIAGGLGITAAFMVSISALGAVSQEDAKRTAQRYVPSGSVFSEIKTDEGSYEVWFYKDSVSEIYEVELDIDTGKILSFESDLYKKGASNSQILLTSDQAEEIVKKELPGVTVNGSKLDQEDGRSEYEVWFQADGYYGDYTISPKDGTVLERDIKMGSWRDGRADKAAYDGWKETDGVISQKEAVRIAKAQIPGGTVTDVDFEVKKSGSRYEVELYQNGTEYDLVIDAVTGQILKSESSKGQKKTVNHTADAGNDIGAERAKEIALAGLPGGVVTKCELDYEDGRRVYEVEVQKGRVEYSCEIDAATGQILSSETDYDD